MLAAPAELENSKRRAAERISRDRRARQVCLDRRRGALALPARFTKSSAAAQTGSAGWCRGPHRELLSGAAIRKCRPHLFFARRFVGLRQPVLQHFLTLWFVDRNRLANACPEEKQAPDHLLRRRRSHVRLEAAHGAEEDLQHCSPCMALPLNPAKSYFVGFNSIIAGEDSLYPSLAMTRTRR